MTTVSTLVVAVAGFYFGHGGLAGDDERSGPAPSHALVLLAARHRNEARSGGRTEEAPGRPSRYITSTEETDEDVDQEQAGLERSGIPGDGDDGAVDGQDLDDDDAEPAATTDSETGSEPPAQQPEKPPQQPGTPGM